MGITTQAIGTLTLDRTDSAGEPGREVRIEHRLMAKAPDEELWFGFVLTTSSQQVISPGGESQVGVAFLNDVEARATFKARTPMRFGDGVRVRGTLVLEKYID
ncbi:hypothetical protein [Pseudoxanthomonas indica]|uniref:Uncharacterized protein n=1 Tax=Pseudoxanthomonas indica TaxID=428993 RepID=A0A1T5K6E6_9GAMM|nr:hypothetical protein [Pseudoxanthomonas indica]GGD47049.1 hypothetical protein GCM10007235_18680 [Pseudoxanthomonas indica]SKC59193.1 hypothetical protein SAMN06296058_1405 [Pseudoxanthomonas indica]